MQCYILFWWHILSKPSQFFTLTLKNTEVSHLSEQDYMPCSWQRYD
jgi:hypothetical protein